MKRSADALQEGKYKTFTNSDELMKNLGEEINNADDNSN